MHAELLLFLGTACARGKCVLTLVFSVLQWSLGCILPELFTGKLLFDNESVSTMLASQQSILGNFDRAFIERGSFCGGTARLLLPALSLQHIVFDQY